MIENGLGFQLVPWSPSLEREWPRSLIVHELQRENFQLTSGWRARLGDVILFDRQTRQAPPTTCEVREAQNVCISWLIPKGGARAPQPLGKTSHSLLVGAILHVLYAEAVKTLAGAELGDRVHPVVASASRELLNKSENERSGVLSTTMSFLGLYRDPVVAKVTARSLAHSRSRKQTAARFTLFRRAAIRHRPHKIPDVAHPQSDRTAPDREPGSRPAPSKAPPDARRVMQLWAASICSRASLPSWPAMAFAVS